MSAAKKTRGPSQREMDKASQRMEEEIQRQREEAEACLSAAAPELLASSKRLAEDPMNFEWTNALGEGRVTISAEAYADLRDAIAKAEGRS